MKELCTACGNEIEPTEKPYRSDGCILCEACHEDFKQGMIELALKEAMIGETSETLNRRD